MSDDRELLELAAKAAGLTIAWDARGAYIVAEGVSGSGDVWNPLTDDGDALQLAVKLRFNVDCMTDLSTEVTWAHEESFRSEEQDYTDDRAASVRRAIVRAAAAIGKAQP